MDEARLRRRIRSLLELFILGLVVSGLTAFPLLTEAAVLNQLLGSGTIMERWSPSTAEWISTVYRGLRDVDGRHPFLFYGTDWLAFAHLVIAIAFVGPLRDPVKNVWVVEFGMIACVLVVPMALICGPLRGIPPLWMAVDMSFGVLGFVPLWIAKRYIGRLAELQTT